ncbi:G-protein coupled receptor, putative [Ixodes scapularis]|uniref:G-protein coupled receptor, putative n=1 Tax=Ixodes scapularis TaxID=6945 RepID=B7PPD1_IXOSC|nr:G-protein coupled receptor, putative [Ixodes scapularis]|eukprot:XP_002435623.1 G-protein coupled receptor, putative [Ixodes scapularis]
MGATADRLQQLTTEKRSLDPLDIVYVATTVENIASTGAVSRQGTDVAFVFSKSNQFQLDRELNIGVMGASSLFEDSFQPTDDESSELAFEICSSVLLANYENEEVDNVREPFSIYFKQSCDVTPEEVECVFWDPSENYDLGAWSTAGCEYIGLERGYHVCNCSHLTSFAVLFRHNDRSKRSPHDHILSYLTFIGIALSALGLLMVVFTYICHKRWRKGVGHQILMHLSVALLGALGAYLALVTVPVPRTGPALCACIGGLLHYLLLVSFCWTFVEALLQYLRFVKVLGTYVPNLVLKAALAAWDKDETKDGAKDKEMELYLPQRSRKSVH